MDSFFPELFYLLCMILAFAERPAEDYMSCIKKEAKKWHVILPMHENHALFVNGYFDNLLWYNGGL